MRKFIRLLILPLLVGMITSCQFTNPLLIPQEETGQRIGSLGPVIFKINASLNTDQIKNDLKIEPNVDFDFNMTGGFLSIWPKSFFKPDQEYKLFFDIGIADEKKTNDQKIFSWNFETQPACLLYIASAIESPEIWRFCLNDQLKTQLSHTNGRINDFVPSSNGKWIAYSTKNEEGGSDIWLMDRDGNSPRIVYSCQTEVCTEVRFLSGDSHVAFEKILQKPNSKNQSIEIYSVDPATLRVSVVDFDENVDPVLMDSPIEGEKVTIFDQDSSMIWIKDFKSGSTIKLPAGEGLGGSWNRLDGTFAYSRMVYWGGIPYGEVLRYDPALDKNEILLGGETDLMEYFSPQWRPQNDWLAVEIRPIEGSASKQIALFSNDGKQRIEVTKDQSFSYGLFSWSLDGEMIAYQRFQMGTSNAEPEIGLWRMEDQSHFILEKGASSPKWIP